MADEMEWSGYANSGTFDAGDTFLLRALGGAGKEVGTVGLWGQFRCGDSVAGSDVPLSVAQSGQDIQARFGVLEDGRSPFIRLQGRSSSSAIRYGDIQLDAEAGAMVIYAPSSGGPTNKALNVNTMGNVYPGLDGSRSLGLPANRWSTVYAATGSINTSDEREKTWRGELTDDEYAAALQIIDELGFFQWNEAVSEKGPDGARYHFGVRAQRAFDILDAHLGEGAWQSFAFACYDSWDEKTEYIQEEEIVPAVVDDHGNEVVPQHTRMVRTDKTKVVREAGDRYGLREGQFNMFLLAAQARRQKELELRIEALEA